MIKVTPIIVFVKIPNLKIVEYGIQPDKEALPDTVLTPSPRPRNSLKQSAVYRLWPPVLPILLVHQARYGRRPSVRRGSPKEGLIKPAVSRELVNSIKGAAPNMLPPTNLSA